MEGDVEMAAADGAAAVGLDDMKKRLKEMEDEAAALREMKAKVEQEMGAVQAPEGDDKYKVAKRWGHIYVVNRKWFHQSVARKACLSEESYPVQGTFASSLGSLKRMEQHSQDMEPDHEIPLPDKCPSVCEVPQLPKEEEDPPADERKHDYDFSRCIADDSQCEGDDLYLSECRILLVGFEPSGLRKLVEMVRQGGGSRYMSFNQKLTHIIVVNPSENEINEVRSHTAIGVVYTVKTTWLEECTF